MENSKRSLARQLGMHLRRARESAGLSQTALAARLGLPARSGQPRVSQAETGRSVNMSFETLLRYAYALEVQPSVFVAELEQAGVFDSLRAGVEARVLEQPDRAAKSESRKVKGRRDKR